MCQWKNSENRLIFGEDVQNDKVGRFFETQCIYTDTQTLEYFSLIYRFSKHLEHFSYAECEM